MCNRRTWEWGVSILAAAALAAWVIPVNAQGQSQAQSSASQQSSAQQPSPPADDSDSVAAAARKAKGDKNKPAPKKVITDDDLSSIKGKGVSVVGDEPSGADKEAPAAEKSGAAPAAKPGVKDEAYWRARAKQIRDQMTAIDQQIEQTQEEIKKGGGAGFDAQTGLNQNVIYFEDRNSKLKKLEGRKADLQKQMDDLEDEARKANVPAGWLR
jgi:hypothetical protein